MGLNRFERALSSISPGLALNRARKRIALDLVTRNYDGASRKKRNKNWKVNLNTKDFEVLGASEALRARAREMYNNNAYAKRAIDIYVNNIVGKGIKVDFKDKKLEELFKIWAKQCDYKERLTFESIQSLIMETIARDGEVLIRRIRTRSTDNLPVPLQLEIIEPDYLALDLNKAKTGSGNSIVMGVEYNSKGKRLYYHIYKEFPGTSFSKETFRVNAKDIVHAFKAERANQTRGITWLHSVMQRLKDFNDWENNQLVKMKLSTCFMGFIKEMEPGDFDVSKVESKDGSSTEEEDYELEAGTMKRLPHGTTVEFPKLPSVEGLSDYNKNSLHAIAAGLNITYEQLTNDLSEVNYSSIRAGWLEFQRSVDVWRSHTLYPAINQILFWFTEAATLKGYAEQQSFSLTAPRREMIDPTKEIPALKDAIRSGIHSWSEAQRSLGNDPEEKLQEIKKDFENFEAAGLVLDIIPAKIQKNGALQKSESEADTTENNSEN